MELFCVTLKVHVILLCANTWWPEKIFCIAHFCSSTSTFFLKCHFWFPGIFKVFGKTDVDNRIIEATIKKPFLARGTLNLKTNGLNEKKWQQKTVFVVNSEWPANFITKQLIAIATKLTSKLEQQNQELHIVWKLLKTSHLNFWVLTDFSTQFAVEQQKCYPQRLTRLGSQPITFSKLPGKFIISRITSLGSSSNRMKKFHILCTWPKFNIDEELGLNDSIIIQDRFHLLCWSKMMH